jgi:hypothetical protein
MAGFREFVTGEVLTAANVDDFLAKQAVMKFADAAARDTALGTAVAVGNALREGMVAYLDDEDLPSFYNGTTWTTEFGGGGLVAVKHALFTGIQSASTAASANFAITDVSITHTLADAANKLIITGFCGFASGSEQRAKVGIAAADDGALISIGAAAGVRPRVTAGGSVETAGTILGLSHSFTIVYEPGDDAEHTYTLRAINTHSATQTVHINRSDLDNDSAGRTRAASGLVIQEVKV